MNVQDLRFSKADRLRQRREYVELDRRGQRLSHACFIVMIAPGLTERARLGVTVSRRVGGAVVRNRIKRRLRELFRLQRQLWNGSWDMNIIARRGAVMLSYAETTALLQRLIVSYTKRTQRSNAS